MTFRFARSLALAVSRIVCVSVPTAALFAQSLGPGDLDSLSCSAARAVLETEAGFESVVNPVVSSFAEVQQKVVEFRRLAGCLDGQAIDSDRDALARVYVDLFLAFLGPYRGSAPGASLELVDMRTTMDPGVSRLREDVGLEPPRGLVFVRYFASADAMPPQVRRAFENPQAQAVTIGTRYVAVLTPTPRSVVQENMLDDALASALSHELIHAFLNARLGAGIFEAGFPNWFHEGMAIHFSGSGRGHVAIDHGAGSIFRIEPTVEYEQYERVFRYMEAELGAVEFHRAVREAVDRAEPLGLPARLGYASYRDLQRQAEFWWRWRPIPVTWLVAPRLWGVLIVTAISGAALWHGWRRWEPAVPGSALETGVNADLFEAVKSAADEAVVRLLRSGAAADAVDAEGWSALHWAVFLNRTRAVEALLAAGARPSTQLLAFADSRDTVPEILRLLADRLDLTGDG